MVASRLSRRRSLSRLASQALFVLILFSLSLGGAFWYLSQPTGLEVGQVRIEPGTSARRIGQLLAARGLIRNADVFALTVRFMGVAHRLEAGTYQLSGSKTTPGIIRDLLKAPVRTRRITIPEALRKLDGITDDPSPIRSRKASRGVAGLLRDPAKGAEFLDRLEALLAEFAKG